MAEFTTTAALEIEVDQRSLRSARKEIESNAGSVSMGVDSPSPLRADGGGLSNFNRNKASRERAMSRQLLTSQVELLDDIKDEIEKAGVSGGGGGGGGGGSGVGGTLLQALGLRSVLGGGGGMAAGLLASPFALAGGAGLAIGGGLGLAARQLGVDQSRRPMEAATGTRGMNPSGPPGTQAPSPTEQLLQRQLAMSPEERAQQRSERTVRDGEADRGRSELNITNNVEIQSLDEFRRKLEENKQDVLRQVEEQMGAVGSPGGTDPQAYFGRR